MIDYARKTVFPPLRAAHFDRDDTRQPYVVVLRSYSRTQFEKSLNELESTSTVRLFAEFEGILRDHLVFRWSYDHGKLKNARVQQLLSWTLKAEKLTIDRNHIHRIEQVRRYRNSIAHQSDQLPQVVPFTEALERLGKIVERLSEPYRN